MAWAQPKKLKIGDVLQGKDGKLLIAIDDYKKGLVIQDDSGPETRWFRVKAITLTKPKENSPDFVINQLIVDLNNDTHVEELVEADNE